MTPEHQHALAAVRYGFGLSPAVRGLDPADLVAGLLRPDPMPERFPVPTMAEARALRLAFRDATRALRENPESEELLAAKTDAGDATANAFRQSRDALLLRAVDSPVPFRERLVAFWSDHFATRYHQSNFEHVGTFHYEAIGANLTGRFADLLGAVATHPIMLDYLDQRTSVGPGSRAGAKTGQGLNENYARELMELHTLGVDGSYAQGDVRQAAELLTGMMYGLKRGFVYQKGWAEPGPETILGRTYGGDGPARFADVETFLEDLSVHPDTARHVSGRMAAHFVSDDPDPDLVDHMATAWTRTGGDLPAVYTAMLEHPAAWVPELGKVKPPFDYIVSSLRALGMDGERLVGRGNKLFNQYYVRPSRAMGQDPLNPPGPDGWPERAEAWIAPHLLAARIRWAMRWPGKLVDELPDPRRFVETALGPLADERMNWAARASESRAQGVGLVLASPVFNRR